MQPDDESGDPLPTERWQRRVGAATERRRWGPIATLCPSCGEPIEVPTVLAEGAAEAGPGLEFRRGQAK